ncbi:MAG: signal peptidase I [Planctomycetes bacterium RBG_19FT_COMBO_48_8]|nr:MAG: signal peptidase I [Planctomycetes bacterium RBG_19FT_COMBO_48_8]
MELIQKSYNCPKEPWLAVFLSKLIPGLGQIYIKKRLLGIVLIIAAGFLLAVGIKYPLLCVVLLSFFSMPICYHAYISAPIRRDSSNRTISIVVIVILCSHLLNAYGHHAFKAYVAEAFVIPTRARLAYPLPANISLGTSMKSTLVPGDRIFVRKSKKYIPKRGDVIVFKSPDDPDTPWIKRVAALPGETLEIKNEILYIDEQKIKHPALKNIEYPPMDYVGMEGEPYVVPENHIFVIGDNTANSEDSRAFGAIPLSDVVGKAYKIYWPLGRRGPIK